VSKFANGRSATFYPFGTYNNITFLSDKFDKSSIRCWEQDWEQEFFHCYFFDQEPMYDYTLPIVRDSILNQAHIAKPGRIHILANSDISSVTDQAVNNYGMYNWYYFFHGFAALDWYRDFQYIEPESFNRFDKVFICYNHLTSKLRSYRLHLVSNLIEQDLVRHGHVSLFHKGWQTTIQDPNTPLDNRARVKIYKTLKNIDKPLIIDTEEPNGSLSAVVSVTDLTSALFHVVTETVYFDTKLHLTEKVFKPIVSKRPFFLVSTPGSLAYLKSYGFRTFDRWIDESYDLEQDHYIRIEKITEEIARLCAMEPADLIMMHKEMQEVLEYNFNHFYTSFKNIIIDELVDNFKELLLQIAVDRNHHLTIPNLEEVKKRLKQ
jgi:hypothetical protein